MERTTDNAELVRRNGNLPGGEHYQGYLLVADRESTVRVWPSVAEKIASLADQLGDQVEEVAKHATFHAIESINDTIKRTRALAKQIGQEPENPFYRLPEVTCHTATDLVQADNAIMLALSEFGTAVRKTINTMQLDEEHLDHIHLRFDELYQAVERRDTLTRSSEENWTEIQTGIEALQTHIDNKDVHGFHAMIHKVFQRAEGLTKPYYEVLNILIDRQLFIFRRASRALDRDNPALRYYDIFVEFLEQTERYCSERQAVLEHLPCYQKLAEVPALLLKIRNKRDELYQMSAPEEGDHENEGTNRSLSPINFGSLALAGGLLLTAVVVLFFVF